MMLSLLYLITTDLLKFNLEGTFFSYTFIRQLRDKFCIKIDLIEILTSEVEDLIFLFINKCFPEVWPFLHFHTKRICLDPFSRVSLSFFATIKATCWLQYSKMFVKQKGLDVFCLFCFRLLSIYMRLRDKRILIDIFRKIRLYDLNLWAYFIFNIRAKFDN